MSSKILCRAATSLLEESTCVGAYEENGAYEEKLKFTQVVQSVQYKQLQCGSVHVIQYCRQVEE
eukprot:9077099-Pyramimonas_sp.AAC.1